nr:ribulose-phosphate 3-epimerase [bacterium]
MQNGISASMMCCDFGQMARDIAALEEAGIEYLHIDVMDGHFVPNLTMGPDVVAAIRRYTHLPLDFHFMTDDPMHWIDVFKPREGDLVAIHAESTPHAARALPMIAATGATPGIALNPGTPLSALDYLAPLSGFVLLMTVNPGYAGQPLAPGSLDKIRDTKAYLGARGLSLPIEVDGNVSCENARKMAAAGADLFVAGTSSVFSKSGTILSGAEALRNAISLGKAGLKSL